MRQKVIPARISMALALRSLEPADTDVRLGVFAGMVDLWCEAGDEPDDDQLITLAELTGFPVEFFYRPILPQERKPTRIFICERGRKRSLTIVRSWIDDRNVLHSEIE